MPLHPTKALNFIQQAQDHQRLSHAYLIQAKEANLRYNFSLKLISQVLGITIRNDAELLKLGGIILRPESASKKIIIGENSDEPNSIRNLQKKVNQIGGIQGYKIALIVDADCMTENAQNAFLKTLEEPPAKTLLLLLTANPRKLLPTTLSRVVSISLLDTAPPQLNQEHHLLLNTLAETTHKKPSLALALAIKAQFDQILAQLEIKSEQEMTALLNTEKDLYRNKTDGNWLKQREEQLQAKQKADYLNHRNDLIQIFLSWLSDIAKLQTGSQRLTYPHLQTSLTQLANHWTQSQILQKISYFHQLDLHLRTNANESLMLDQTFIKAFSY
jgi:DNA polymerase-3 subunit delta'